MSSELKKCRSFHLETLTEALEATVMDQIRNKNRNEMERCRGGSLWKWRSNKFLSSSELQNMKRTEEGKFTEEISRAETNRVRGRGKQKWKGPERNNYYRAKGPNF